MAAISKRQSVLENGRSLPVTPPSRQAGAFVFLPCRLRSLVEGVNERAPAGRLKGWWGKIEGRALRLALVLELLDWASDRLQEPEPQEVGASALRLLEEYFWPMAQRAFGEADGNSIDPLLLSSPAGSKRNSLKV